MHNGNAALQLPEAATIVGMSEADQAERDILGWAGTENELHSGQTPTLTEVSGLSMVRTPRGIRRLAELCVGDEVETLDDGPMPIQAITRVDTPPQRPVVISPGLLGASREIAFGPARRLFFRGGAADLLFGAPDVLIEARDLPKAYGARRGNWQGQDDAIAIALERPALIWADDVITETGHAPVFAATRPVLKPMEAAALLKFAYGR